MGVPLWVLCLHTSTESSFLQAQPLPEGLSAPKPLVGRLRAPLVLCGLLSHSYSMLSLTRYVVASPDEELLLAESCQVLLRKVAKGKGVGGRECLSNAQTCCQLQSGTGLNSALPWFQLPHSR